MTAAFIMFSPFNLKYYHCMNIFFSAWSYPLIATVMWNNKLNLLISTLDSFFTLFIIFILTHSSIKWILDQMISKILPAWTFYVPQIDAKAMYYPSIENNFQAQIHSSKIASPTITAIEFCPFFFFTFYYLSKGTSISKCYKL